MRDVSFASRRDPLPAQPLPGHRAARSARSRTSCGSLREHLGEEAELLERDSAALGRSRAAVALLRGGLAPDDVAAAVRRTGARVVSAHNLNPAFGWRALAAARAAGARVVLHLHNYRLVCAVGTCFNSRGEDCVRCHGPQHAARRAPGLPRHRAPRRPSTAPALALWQRRLAAQADAVVVPSRFAAQRLRALRAPLDPARVHVVPHVVRAFAERLARGGRRARARRLAPGAGEGRRRRGAGVRAGGPAARGGRRRPAGRGAARRAGGGALRRARVAPRSSPTCARAPRWRSCPRARPRPSAWPRPRRWPPACPSWPAAVGALPELVGPEGVVAPGDADALAAAARSALRRRGGGRRRAAAHPRAGVARRGRRAPARGLLSARELLGRLGLAAGRGRDRGSRSSVAPIVAAAIAKIAPTRKAR